jgi:V/A-type H+-transporting ATPase subunit E
MSQQVQELIDKIKTEGVQAAEQKAKEIEEQAKKKAQGILNEAEKRAQELLVKAEADIKKKQDASRLALQQASRDTLLSLKKEIQKLLQKIVTLQVADALTAPKLADMIAEISRKAIETQLVDRGVEVVLNPKDLKEVRDGFMAKFQKQLQQPVEFKAAEDVGKGFTISFDRGKSSFDFSQEALAGYLSVYLNEEMASLLKSS